MSIKQTESEALSTAVALLAEYIGVEKPHLAMQAHSDHFRLDATDNWKPNILEINPLPGLSLGVSDLVIEAAAEGVEHTHLVNMILDTALRRYQLI